MLYLVPTPIGNLEDMTFRAVSVLKEADIIAAEDTRQTKKLCHVYEIETQLVSYHEHNKESSGHKILEWLKEGKNVALVSDAGMPTISDPGAEIVRDFIEMGGYVVPLPGANAALTALIASGIAPQPFFFFGFLDRNKRKRKKQLEALKNRQETMIFYESPHRLKETLSAIREVFGNRQIALTRELTKNLKSLSEVRSKKHSHGLNRNRCAESFALWSREAVKKRSKNRSGGRIFQKKNMSSIISAKDIIQKKPLKKPR